MTPADGGTPRPRWPPWWEWELDLSPHLTKRMLERRFTEIDLRAMLSEASARRRGLDPGRWIIETRHDRRRWEVVVEPDPAFRLLVVITAYPLG